MTAEQNEVVLETLANGICPSVIDRVDFQTLKKINKRVEDKKAKEKVEIKEYFEVVLNRVFGKVVDIVDLQLLKFFINGRNKKTQWQKRK